jgi:hypothetical protein
MEYVITKEPYQFEDYYTALGKPIEILNIGDEFLILAFDSEAEHKQFLKEVKKLKSTKKK